MGLKTFEKGIHPDYNKYLTASKAVRRAGIPSTVYIPLRQHTGAPCQPLVKRGDVVEEGQKIGDVDAFVSAPVHASISGKVKDIDLFPHPAGGSVPTVVIEGNGEEKVWKKENVEVDVLDPDTVRRIVREAGIVGMGGAGFPTSVKLSPPKDRVIDTVILNGCECEPYLTADHRLMVEEPEGIVEGLRIIMKTVGARKGVIGIEDNKPDAIEALSDVLKRVQEAVEIVALETKYPQGAEKMLIRAILSRRVPPGKLPHDVGVVVNNVGTALAIYEALVYKKPLIERVVTVSGNGVVEPSNLRVRVGTTFQNAIEQCGGIKKDGEMVVLNGGPMMGISQRTTEVPVTKGTSGITVLSAEEIKPTEYGPCIRCASCVEVCPMGLVPFRIADMGRLFMVSGFGDWGGMNCIECGCCSFICPAKRPLLQWIRIGKLKFREEEKGVAA